MRINIVPLNLPESSRSDKNGQHIQSERESL